MEKEKKNHIETADGKRRDEEGCEMGVWVVLSGGRGGWGWGSGGRICLCYREHGPVIKAIHQRLNILSLMGSVVNYPSLSR